MDNERDGYNALNEIVNKNKTSKNPIPTLQKTLNYSIPPPNMPEMLFQVSGFSVGAPYYTELRNCIANHYYVYFFV